MKKYILPLVLISILASCKKEDGTSFSLNEPITEWNLSKSEVKNLEKRTLQDESDYELIYKGNDPETLIYYEFDEIPDSVYLARSDIGLVHNQEMLNNAFDFLKSKYGNNYTEHHYDDGSDYYSWDSGGTHIELEYTQLLLSVNYYRINN